MTIEQFDSFQTTFLGMDECCVISRMPHEMTLPFDDVQISGNECTSSCVTMCHDVDVSPTLDGEWESYFTVSQTEVVSVDIYSTGWLSTDQYPPVTRSGTAVSFRPSSRVSML